MSQEGQGELQSEHLPWIWAGAFVIVGVFGYGMTPWDAIIQLIENNGVGDQGAYLLAFAAGYTLPATAAIGVIVALAYTGALRNVGLPGTVFLIALILGGAAILSQFLGLGLIVDLSNATWHSGPVWLSVFLFVLSAYLNAYGWPLMITAVALGIASGLHFGIKTEEYRVAQL